MKEKMTFKTMCGVWGILAFLFILLSIVFYAILAIIIYFTTKESTSILFWLTIVWVGSACISAGVLSLLALLHGGEFTATWSKDDAEEIADKN